jgi:hypothetical protein
MVKVVMGPNQIQHLPPTSKTAEAPSKLERHGEVARFQETMTIQYFGGSTRNVPEFEIQQSEESDDCEFSWRSFIAFFAHFISTFYDMYSFDASKGAALRISREFLRIPFHNERLLDDVYMLSIGRYYGTALLCKMHLVLKYSFIHSPPERPVLFACPSI